MESSLVRIQSIRQDTDKQVNEHYKARVQLQEQIDDHCWQLDFCRGAAEASGQVEKYLVEGDLAQALLRLQSLRVETYCQLSEHFKATILLKDQLIRNDRQLNFHRGVASTNGGETKAKEAELKIKACCEMDMLLREQMEANDERVHFYRGMIASFDESERIVNEEMNPKKIPGGVPTSPGVVGPNFEGLAMPPRPFPTNAHQPRSPQTVPDQATPAQSTSDQTKPNGISFPTYDKEYDLPNYPEFQPDRFGHDKLEEITGQ